MESVTAHIAKPAMYAPPDRANLRLAGVGKTMAYEKMEREFPCLCGRGKMITEWEEHDTWPSYNQGGSNWRFECPICAVEYEFYSKHILDPQIIRRVDADRHRALSAEVDLARRRLLEVAIPRYEKQWVGHVLSLPTKKAKHNAVADCSYGTFIKRANCDRWIADQARSRFRTRTAWCLNQLKIQDPEINDLTEAARIAQGAADAFWASIDKKNLP